MSQIYCPPEAPTRTLQSCAPRWPTPSTRRRRACGCLPRRRCAPSELIMWRSWTHRRACTYVVGVPWDYQSVDPALIGVIGTAAGAAATGLVDVCKMLVQNISTGLQEKRRIEHEKEQADLKRKADTIEATAQRDHTDKQRRRELAAEHLASHLRTVAHWREQLRFARNVRDQWNTGGHEPWDEDPTNLVGEEWFEELRPLLSTDGKAGEIRTATVVEADLETVALLSLEIGRLEQKWRSEAQE